MKPIERLVSVEAIKTLRIKYAHLLDSNNISRLDEVFAQDAVVDAGRGRWEGIDDVLAGLREAYAAFDRPGIASYPFHHAVTNHWVEFIDENTAQGRCYLIDLQTDPTRERWLLLGTYADEYRREEGRWIISRSRLDVTWPEPSVGGGLPGTDLVLPS